MVTRILWLRAFTGYGILVLLGIVGVLWIGMEIVMAIHTKTSSAAKLWTMDIVANIIEMLLNGIGLLVPIFIAAFVISLFVH
jgi:hypothetical protein